MKKINIIFCHIFMVIFNCKADEFIYPVAQIDDQNIFIVHQKAADDLSLFLWNIESKVAVKELSSIFLPSHIKMLPSKIGFSFLNRGRIQIKLFQKRAPKSIDILEPIDSIASMHWINDNQFYMVGKYLQHYKVFLCNLCDTSYQIYFLTNLDTLDYIYPSKIDNSLFCISKNEDQHYFITKQSWHPTPYGQPRAHNFQKTIFESDQPLCFLHMKNSNYGYFLKCTSNANKLLFTCYRLIKEDGSWHTQSLFSFKVPIKYVMGESQDRVYESIYPFLPNYEHNENIFFVDYDDELQSLLIYSYNINSENAVPLITQKRAELDCKGFLAPLISQNLLFYGLVLSPASLKQVRSILRLDQETGVFNLNLPGYSLDNAHDIGQALQEGSSQKP